MKLFKTRDPTEKEREIVTLLPPSPEKWRATVEAGKNLLSLGELEARKERELRGNKLVCYVNKLSASLLTMRRKNKYIRISLLLSTCLTRRFE